MSYETWLKHSSHFKKNSTFVFMPYCNRSQYIQIHQNLVLYLILWNAISESHRAVLCLHKCLHVNYNSKRYISLTLLLHITDMLLNNERKMCQYECVHRFSFGAQQLCSKSCKYFFPWINEKRKLKLMKVMKQFKSVAAFGTNKSQSVLHLCHLGKLG